MRTIRALLLALAVPLHADIQSGALPQVRAAPRLNIRQLDVGQGDAALITTPEGRTILIDAGPGATKVAELLRKEGIDTLDLVIASHNHADHIGGMAAVFSAVVVRAYVENGLPHTTATYRRTLAAVEREAGLRYLEATDRVITLGSVTMRILPPSGTDDSQNNNSVGVLIEYGRFRALYIGDAEHPALADWLGAGRISRATLVKVSHHGSWNGTTARLVEAAAPAIALISVGAANRYGHPSPQVEKSWSDRGAFVYRTDINGTIDVMADRDGSFTVRPQRSPPIEAR